ncbi:cytochrome c biogenesis protein CcdA [Methanolacinia paynteri]|uniref:cytochrome c biogenesis protein CcdA n=1 Tax=Methanolacinia paynteri TaxID=230356 RepID=UPI00064E712D|nr:cytochrome c biogenesis protein CcdA [Methanolacinia paynteri]
MIEKKKYLLILCILSSYIIIASANTSTIPIQYFHQQNCPDCEKTDPLIAEFANSYNDTIIEWIDTSTLDGYNRWKKFGFFEVPAIVINNEIKIPKNEITKENLREKINSLQIEQSNENTNTSTIQPNLSIPVAYSLGLFAGFSPCLMAILGFIFTITASKSKGVQSGICMAIMFGFGLITAYIIIGTAIIFSLGSFDDTRWLSIIAGLISLIFGLNLIGIIKTPSSIDTYFHNKSKQYIGSWTGLFGLGLLFSVVKVPCSAPMLLVLIEQMFNSSSISALTQLLTFCGGILTPFLAIGIIGGATLTQKVRNYRIQIQIISGIFLLIFGIWIIFFNL